MTTETTRSAPPPRPFKHLGAGIAGAIALAILIFLLLFQWNWLRGPLASAISARVHRPVKITGNLEVHPWSWSPRATVHGLVIGNIPWAGKDPMVDLPSLTVQIKILPLLKGQVILPLLDAEHPTIRLMRNSQGQGNWETPNQKPKPLKLPAITHLILNGGSLTYRDIKHHLDFAGTISTNEAVNGHGQGDFVLDGKGSLNTARFLAHISGGPLVNVDPRHPYPFHATIEAGPTHVQADGVIVHPFNFGDVDGRFSVSGPDLADLYYLTGLTFPNSPPYQLSALFNRDPKVYTLRKLTGRLGQSDLEGTLIIDTSNGRPFVSGELVSRQLRYDDLTAIFGGAPRRGHAGALSPMQKQVSAKLSAEHRIFPDTHLDVTRVRAMDAKVRYRATSVAFGKVPIRSLVLGVGLKDGVLDINPLELSLPQGHVGGSVRIDARANVPAEAIDLKLTNARLETFTPNKKGGPPPIEGALLGRTRLTSRGDSVRSTAANANGALTMAINGGEIRQALAELLGIDATKGLFMLLSKSERETPIRCAVLDMRAHNGLLVADRLIIDTGVVLVNGQGDIDLRNETLSFVLNGKPKKFRLVRLNAPITFKGGLTSPKVGVQLGKAAPQALLSIAAGALIGPAAAILPFIHPGTSKDADCGGLMAAAASGPSPVKRH